MNRVWPLIFAATAGLILHLAVPPFQNPDEPTHFSLIVRTAWGDERRAEIEREIIRLMDRCGWWRSVGMGRPDPLPEKFEEIPILSFGYKGDVKDLHR
ncbi:MAG: hypothetical protein FJY83_08475, partial [Candidatus Aminicenantes bacterium]|nr:hypothetical protein [Candidatus Aminicenantes bacterium]